MNWWNLIKQNDPKMVDPAEQEEMDKALVGGQKGLDKDKDGDIDAKDFKALRDGAMKKTMDEFLLAIDNLVKAEGVPNYILDDPLHPDNPYGKTKAGQGRGSNFTAHMNPDRKINVRIKDVHNLHVDISELAEELKNAKDEGELTRITGELKQKVAALKKLKHHSSSGYLN